MSNVPRSTSVLLPEDDGVTAVWGSGADGMKCGRLTGFIEESGWQWKVSSEGAVWLWLNCSGDGLIWGERDRFFLKPGMYAMTGGDGVGDWNCVRHPGEQILEVVVIPRNWLKHRVGGSGDGLHPGLAKWLSEGGPVAFCGLMGVWERDLCDALAQAAELSGPSRLLAEARVLDWAAARLFRKDSGNDMPEFNTGPNDQNPVRKAVRLLGERLDQPLDLGTLSQEVGVSRHHLSRRVRSQTGSTLQQHLRRLRIEHACEALVSKRMSVTEVALEVGYQSLSHFAKAFREETGRSPREWVQSQNEK